MFVDWFNQLDSTIGKLTKDIKRGVNWWFSNLTYSWLKQAYEELNGICSWLWPRLPVMPIWGKRTPAITALNQNHWWLGNSASETCEYFISIVETGCKQHSLELADYYVVFPEKNVMFHHSCLGRLSENEWGTVAWNHSVHHTLILSTQNTAIWGATNDFQRHPCGSWSIASTKVWVVVTLRRSDVAMGNLQNPLSMHIFMRK